MRGDARRGVETRPARQTHCVPQHTAFLELASEVYNQVVSLEEFDVQLELHQQRDVCICKLRKDKQSMNKQQSPSARKTMA